MLPYSSVKNALISVSLALIPLKDTDKPPMVIELKYDKTTDSAIKQIKERRYTNALKDFVTECNGEEILLVGINYDKDSEDKKHICIIESFSPTIE